MSSTPVIPVPSRIDSAEAVRDYIKKVLTESQGMSDESGYHSASEWKSGDGKELREMRVHQFRTTFGNRIGHILYKEVRTQVLEEEDAMSVPWTREARDMWLIGVMAIEVAVNVVYFFVLRCSMGFGILIFWALGICMVTCLARDSLFTRPSPHETVERELRDGYGSAYSA